MNEEGVGFGGVPDGVDALGCSIFGFWAEIWAWRFGYGGFCSVLEIGYEGFER